MHLATEDLLNSASPERARRPRRELLRLETPYHNRRENNTGAFFVFFQKSKKRKKAFGPLPPRPTPAVPACDFAADYRGFFYSFTISPSTRPK